MDLVIRQSIVIYTLQFNFKNKIAATVHNIQVSIVIRLSIYHKARCDRGIHYSHLDKNYTGNIDKIAQTSISLFTTIHYNYSPHSFQ